MGLRSRGVNYGGYLVELRLLLDNAVKGSSFTLGRAEDWRDCMRSLMEFGCERDCGGFFADSFFCNLFSIQKERGSRGFD